jgi:predicted GIY-YIG superfamily endonuclease
MRLIVVRMAYLYVYRCVEGKIYVGITDNIKNRHYQHMSGNGSEWTKKYNIIEKIEQRECKSKHDENNTTLEYMEKYGIPNVRGGAWTKINLSPSEISAIKKQINGTKNACYKCGKTGHYAKKCSNNTNPTSTETIVHKPQEPVVDKFKILDIVQSKPQTHSQQDAYIQSAFERFNTTEEATAFLLKHPFIAPPEPPKNSWLLNMVGNVVGKIENEFTNPESHLRKFFK